MVSIIIPLYNQEKYIERCIISVINQEYNDIEIIIIDDGSNDNSVSICEKYREIDSRVKLIRQNNQGLSGARNTGLNCASGDYYLFIDSDDWVSTKLISSTMELFSEDVDIVRFEFQRVSEEGLVINDGKTTCDCYSISGKEATERILTDQFGSQVCTAIYKSKCWKGIRFPEKRLFEDIFTTYRVYHNSNRIIVSPLRLYYYRMNPNSISHKKEYRRNFDIFSGFLEHYTYSQKHCPTVKNKCCAIAAHYAATSLFWVYMGRLRLSAEDKRIVTEFICNNKNEILNNIGLVRATRRALLIFVMIIELIRIRRDSII